jgi:16S rRNA (guanine527-N7)-methyltransferase
MALPLDDAARRAIDAHARLLIAWNAAINLTALRDPEQIARDHVLDSLLAVPILAARGPRSVIDLGSGGGFPGLPLAASMPIERAALVDSIGKKARFLAVAAAAVRGAIDEPRAPAPAIDAIAARAEDLATEPEHRERWDLVVARAVGPVSELAEICLPLTRIGGHVAMWKREAGDGALKREVADAARIVQAAGGAPARIVPLEAAAKVGLEGHCLVVTGKVRVTPDRYPRPASERKRSK